MADPSHISGKVCAECGWSEVFPIENCPRCHALMKDSLFSRKGKVATFTVIRYPPAGLEQESPYLVGLIDIENGPRVIGRINSEPNRLEIGTYVTFVRDRNGVLEFTVEV